jgi:hypothetical protein
MNLFTMLGQKPKNESVIKSKKMAISTSGIKVQVLSSTKDQISTPKLTSEIPENIFSLITWNPGEKVPFFLWHNCLSLLSKLKKDLNFSIFLLITI